MLEKIVKRSPTIEHHRSILQGQRQSTILVHFPTNVIEIRWVRYSDGLKNVTGGYICRYRVISIMQEPRVTLTYTYIFLSKICIIKIKCIVICVHVHMYKLWCFRITLKKKLWIRNQQESVCTFSDMSVSALNNASRWLSSVQSRLALIVNGENMGHWIFRLF